MYLVHELVDDGLNVFLANAREIIDRIDMSDCIGAEYRVFETDGFGELSELKIHGCWHDFKRPLYIKAVRADGSIAFDGYGTDH